MPPGALLHRTHESAAPVTISAVIPVWNESARIAQAVERLGRLGLHEIIVVDCESDDTTASLAQGAGARVVQSKRGRGCQMNAGAQAASGDVLWFVHADVTVPEDATALIRQALDEPSVVAGAFRTQTVQDIGSSWVRHFLPLADFRSSYTQLPYGDQALFVRSSTFHDLGGFKDQRLMEDLELAQRLRRKGSIEVVSKPVLVSGRRFIARPMYTTWVMYSFPILYRLGVSTDTLERWYGSPR